jgi:hypothetical protein
LKPGIQEIFFDRIKHLANPQLSLADEIAELLGLSNDSAYRRLRGETAITLEEAAILSRHFGISLEEIAPASSHSVLFGRSTFRDEAIDFDEYLKRTEEYLSRISGTKVKHGIYAAKDVPVFHYMQVPELGKFKLFFWLKTIRSSKAIDAVKFDFDIIPDELVKKGRAVAKIYFQIPFSEIWNEDTINTALRQIDYFHEAGWLANKSVAITLCERAEEMIRIIEEQAETGQRWFDGKPVHPEVAYDLYYNDLVVLDNSMFVETDQFQMSMIGYNAMDYLYTFHHGFCKEAQLFLQKQLKKSMLLSGAAEKERNKFFNRIYDKINALKQRIASS